MLIIPSCPCTLARGEHGAQLALDNWWVIGGEIRVIDTWAAMYCSFCVLLSYM